MGFSTGCVLRLTLQESDKAMTMFGSAPDTKDDKLIGVGVTTHTETPGLGATAKDDPGFVSQFKGMPVKETFKVTNDGGKVNAMSGATITSRAVCSAASDAGMIYKKLKPQLVEKLKEFK